MPEATFTFRVDENLKAKFSEAARGEVGHDAWFRRQVQDGLDSANAGNLIPAAKVEAEFAARRSGTRRRIERTK